LYIGIPTNIKNKNNKKTLPKLHNVASNLNLLRLLLRTTVIPISMATDLENCSSTSLDAERSFSILFRTIIMGHRTNLTSRIGTNFTLEFYHNNIFKYSPLKTL